ncbi:MAG: rane fusion protein YbhG, partial [Candidatus Hydrogenedentes bacterium]|nr:rane fusion protein YbhG [Candidatus Hydrogenedentota bacterium]
AAAEAQLAQAEALLLKLENGARPEELRQAEAAATAAAEQYRMAEKGFRSQEVKGASAALDGARAQRDEAKAEWNRIEPLFTSGAVSEQMRDQSLHAYEAAEAQYETVRQRLDLVAEGFREEEVGMAKAGSEQAAAALDLVRNGARSEDIAAARAARDAAKANLARAQVTAEEMVIVAPSDGIIESIDLHPGDLIGPGPVVSVLNPDDLELIVYVSSILLGQLKLNQEVTLTTDSHGPETFKGHITFIASEGEFTPRNLQTKEERVQQVFGIKIVPNPANGRLRAGMAATAHFPRTGEGI